MLILNVTSYVLSRTENSNVTQPHITSVGGSPSAGLTLLTLHKRAMPAALYEREPSFASCSHRCGFFDLGRDTWLRENGLC